MTNTRRRTYAPFALLVGALFTLAACGGNDPAPAPGPGEPAGEPDASLTPAPGTTSTNGVNPVGANKPPPDAGYFAGGSRHPQ